MTKDNLMNIEDFAEVIASAKKVETKSVFYVNLFAEEDLTYNEKILYSYFIYNSLINEDAVDVNGDIDSEALGNNQKEKRIELQIPLNLTTISQRLDLSYVTVFNANKTLRKKGLLTTDEDEINYITITDQVAESKYFPLMMQSCLKGRELLVYSFFKHFANTTKRNWVFMTNKTAAAKYFFMELPNYLTVIHSLQKKGFLERGISNKLYVR